jgi:coenzyme F420-reducing hydrogenase beta subunit
MIGVTYHQAKNALKQGRLVLFTGTPCQIAGLYAYLQRDYDNLYTCDVLCHGVPSPKVFKMHIQNLEQKYHSQITNYRFRSKYFGWRSHSTRIEFLDGKKINIPGMVDPFMRGFLENLFLRPICSICPYTSTIRTGDISIGDYWGVDKYFPELDDNKGISTVLINTPKGLAVFENCKSELFAMQCDLKQAEQKSLVHPNITSSLRTNFFSDLDRLPFRKLQRKYILGFKQYARFYASYFKNRMLNIFHVIR